jgi:hypothetical protein
MFPEAHHEERQQGQNDIEFNQNEIYYFSIGVALKC